MEKIFSNKKYAIIISLFATFLWGSAIPVIKNTYVAFNINMTDTGGKILVAGIRFFLAGIFTLCYLKLFNKEKINLKNFNYKFLVVLALVQITFQYIFYYVGLSFTQGVKASIIQAANAFIMVIFSVLLIQSEKFTKNKLYALIIGTIGIIVVNLNGTMDFGFTLRGEGAILVSTTLNALGSVLVKKYGDNQNSFVISASQFLIGSIPMLIIGLATYTSDINLSSRSLMFILYGGFISSTAFTLWYLVLKYQSSGEFGIYKLFVPIFGAILSVIFLGEVFTLKLFIGIVLVILGSLVLNNKIKLTKKTLS